MDNLRKIPPQIHRIDNFNLINPVRHLLKNGTPVYILNAGTQDIIKIDIVFFAGTFYQTQMLIARMTSRMLTEGTKKYDSFSISELMDFYGASLRTSCYRDNAVVTLVTLNKHFKSVLPVLDEVVKYPTFPEKDLKVLINKEKAGFIEAMERVDDIAEYNFNVLLFGKEHPYGKLTVVDDFDRVNSEQLKEFYDKYYKPGNFKIIVSGNVSDEIISLLDEHFGQNTINDISNFSDYKHDFSFNTIKEQKNVIFKHDTLQSAIRIGRPTINILHPDFNRLMILNTIFGGYFGSRLMNNIREDKGYTYGIYSSLISFKHSGMFFISTEVGVDVCEKAIEQIYYELKRIRTEKVPENELDIVKNYLLGNLLRSLDGPFSIADKFRDIVDYEIDYAEFINSYIETINKTNTDEIRELAEIYFKETDMIELVVGKK